MKKSTGIVVGALLIIAVVAGFALTRKSDKNTTNSTNNSSSQTMDMSNDSTKNQASSGVTDLTAQSAVSIDISNYAFSQQNIKIKKGTKVTWINKDSVKHTVTSDSGSSQGLDSALLGNGESYSYTFDNVSTYKYHCTPHPYMKATITVVE